jgi:hypothetical protein
MSGGAVRDAGQGRTFMKSTRSVNNGACIEVARCDETVAVRDSKSVVGPVLEFAVDSWAAFIADIRAGRLD